VTDTSKLSSQTPVHGGRGTFLASLSAMSLLSVTSHHHLHYSHNTLSMYKSEVTSRQIPAPSHHHLPYSAHGTRVIVRDLFGSMPVRVKQRAMVSEKQGGNSKEWEGLKKEVISLLLSWPSSVFVILREIGTNQRMSIRTSTSSRATMVDVSNVCSILAQASLIGPGDQRSWVSVEASSSKLHVKGVISLVPSAAKQVQFLTFGITPLVAIDGHNIVYDEINRLFSNSAFGNEDEGSDIDETAIARRAKDARYKSDGYTNKELKGRKGVDRWPMFYINIQQTTSSKRLDVDHVLDDKENNLSEIIELLQAMIIEFLKRHHFRPTRIWFTKGVIKDAEECEAGRTAKSPSSKIEAPKVLKTTKKVKPQKAISNSDLLGVNVKLPSFRRIDSASSQFETWSLIKSGTTIKSTTSKSTTESLFVQGSELHRPSTAPPPSTITRSPSVSLRTLTPDPNTTKVQRHGRRLLSSGGKIIRRPFEDVECPTIPAIPPASKKEVAENEQAEGDDLVKWMNPVTKVTSFVNTRTGLTVPLIKAIKKGDKQSLFTSKPRLSSPNVMTTKPARPEPTLWISSLLQTWDNPVFQPAEIAIPQVSLDGLDIDTSKILHGHHHHCTQLEIDTAFKKSANGIEGRISKEALKNAEVTAQVDKKFILVTLKDESGGMLLVIIDQHAADERIRIEGLLEELCTPPSADCPSESGIATIRLEKLLSFDVSIREIQLFRHQKQHLASWGILYDVQSEAGKDNKNATQRLTVTALPPGIIERCKTSPHLLIELLRTEIWHIHSSTTPHPSNLPHPSHRSWVELIHTCPKGILEMLNSRACRSAIMFNDELSLEQCGELVRRLAVCKMPFTCAHGRPSLIPLVGLGSVSPDETTSGPAFGTAFREWKRRLEESTTGEDL
jgi:DNA mismatch repair protein MLH3